MLRRFGSREKENVTVRVTTMQGGPPSASMKRLLASALSGGQNTIMLKAKELAQMAPQSRRHLAVSGNRSGMTPSGVTLGTSAVGCSRWSDH